MEKINIAELLKDCPSGMELDCTIFDNVSFVGLQDSLFPIIIHTPDGCKFLTPFGCYHNSCSAKCVIFPRGKTTWEGFHKPFEFGDIVITDNNEYAFIYSGENDSFWECYCGVFCGTRDICINSRAWSSKSRNIRLATEEEKEKLFQVIKDNGYEWNSETKTLEKLIEPQFKVGDKITNGKTSITIGYIDDEYYYEVGRNIATRLLIKNQDEWNLIPKRFDINTLIPFESKVLVRHNKDNKWCGSFFSFIDRDFHSHCYKFVTTANKSYPMMIPYKGNEYLLGKTDDCQEFYKTWE